MLFGNDSLTQVFVIFCDLEEDKLTQVCVERSVHITLHITITPLCSLEVVVRSPTTSGQAAGQEKKILKTVQNQFKMFSKWFLNVKTKMN